MAAAVVGRLGGWVDGVLVVDVGGWGCAGDMAPTTARQSEDLLCRGPMRLPVFFVVSGRARPNNGKIDTRTVVVKHDYQKAALPMRRVVWVWYLGIRRYSSVFIGVESVFHQC